MCGRALLSICSLWTEDGFTALSPGGQVIVFIMKTKSLNTLEDDTVKTVGKEKQSI